MCGGYVLRLLCAAVLALFCMTASAIAAEPSFSAHGSVEQVYVTGLAPAEQMALVDRAVVCERGTPGCGGPGPLRGLERVVGPGLGRTGPASERHRDPRKSLGLHGCRREHGRHRLLGRRVRLLRAAPDPRRLRRDRD